MNPPTPSRPVLVRTAAVVLALAVLVVAAVLVFGEREDAAPVDRAAASPSAVPSPTPSVTQEPTGSDPAAPTPAGGADAAPAELPPVPLDGRAEAGDGVVAVLPRIESVQGTGTGPGNVAGPALRVTVRLENGTAEALSLDSVTVNVYYGEERTPASPLDDPSSVPFSGTLVPGGSADGVVVVGVPEDARGTITVEVSHRPGAPLIIFTGSAD